jgi:hypothetical protein
MAKMSGQIFISYRREDGSASAGRLSDRLSNHFPSNQIFMDVDSVDLGEDFVKRIEETVGSCDVLIAVIGKGWLTSCDEEGQRRLDNPEDFVRIEISTALKRDIRVIPVLVDGALMPRYRDVPDDLKALVRRNALQLSHDRFRTDSERLASAVKRALEKAAMERRESDQGEQAEAEISESREKEQLEARPRGQEEQERLETEQREKERLAAERGEIEAKERLEVQRLRKERRERPEDKPQSPPPSSVALSTPRAKREAEKSSAETPKVVYPLSPKSTEPDREKPPPSSSGESGGKSPSKRVIAFLSIAAVLVVGGLIYLAIRPSESAPTQPVATSASPSHAAIPTPTPAPTSFSAVAIASPSPLISVTPIQKELSRKPLATATKNHPRMIEVFGFIGKSNNNPVFQVVKTGAEDEAKKLSQEKDVEIEIDWRTPNEEDPGKQAAAIEELVNAGAGGIAASALAANQLTHAINMAVDSGVPVVMFDSDAPESKRFAVLGTDDMDCGHRVMFEHQERLCSSAAGSAILRMGQQVGRLALRQGRQKQESSFGLC